MGEFLPAAAETVENKLRSVPAMLPRNHRRPRERYKLLKLIGQGGTGAVYKAEDLELDRIIAIKLLHPALANNEQYVNLLKREVVISSQLSHPNIVRVFDLGELHKTTLISMAFVQGESLASILHREGSLSVPRVMHFCRQICSGLAEAHRHGVIHRDLKPQNLLVDQESQLFISDFGLASAASAAQYEAIASSSRPGTLRYMSPEQFHALPTDARSDLFSFGLILYEMLIGKALDVDHNAIGPRAIDRTTGAPAVFPAGVSAPLTAIALRCLAQNPAERYQSASDINEDLTKAEIALTLVRQELPNPSRAIPGRVFGVPKLGRNGAGVLGGVTLAALIAVGAFNFHLGNKQSLSRTLNGLYHQATEQLANRDDRESVERAAKLFESAAKLDMARPSYEGLARARLRLFELSSDRKNLDLAQSALEKAENLGPSSVSLAVLHAEVDLSEGAPERVPSRLAPLLRAKPTDEILRVLAKSQLRLGEANEALESWQRAIQLNPNFWLNHNGFGSALMELGRPEEAEAEFRIVIELSPDSNIGYANLGAAYVAAGEFHRALAVTEKSLAFRATASQYNNLGTALYYTGACYASVELFRRALELKPNSELYLGNLAEAYRCSGDSKKSQSAYANALEHAQSGLAENPADGQLEARLCVYLAKAGQIEKAQLRMAALVKKSGSNPQVLYSAAIVNLVQDQFADAASNVRLALQNGYPLKVAAHDPELKPVWVYSDLKKRFQSELDHEGQAQPKDGEW